MQQTQPVSVEPGKAVFTCMPDESAYNAVSAVCGGLVCTLLDTAMGCALHSTMPKGKGFTSIEIKVNFLKAVRPSSGLLTATGNSGQVWIPRSFYRRHGNRRLGGPGGHCIEQLAHRRLSTQLSGGTSKSLPDEVSERASEVQCRASLLRPGR